MGDQSIWADPERRRRATIMDMRGWRELRTWVIQCGNCDRTATVQAVDKPDDLPPGWGVYRYEIRCDQCLGPHDDDDELT